MIKNIFYLIRPQQWVKNTFVFSPIFFSHHIFEINYWLPCFFSFMAFCLAASGIYCFNDIHDYAADRNHAEKCKRPIASGKISKKVGYFVMGCCFLFSIFVIIMQHFISQTNCVCSLTIILFYVFLNIAYCVKLKHIAIVDMFIISSGFVLRVLIGGLSSDIVLSEWIILMTFLLALFLAVAKRRDDVIIYEQTGIKVRENVNRYTAEFMNLSLCVISSITIMCYIMYTISQEVVVRFNSNFLYLTSVFVLAGIIRYLQLTIVDAKSGSPTKILLKDRFIQLCIFCWLLTFTIIIYL